jgi:hypothetical protein
MGEMIFRHRCPIKDDLRHVKDEGEDDGNLHSFESPDVDTLDIFPASQSGKTGKRNETNERVDVYAGALWPVFVDDDINHECETVEQIGERR